MRKTYCDRCGAAIIKENVFDDDPSAIKGKYVGEVLVGTEWKFPDQEELSIMNTRCDLCDDCQAALDSLVTSFMKNSES